MYIIKSLYFTQSHALTGKHSDSKVSRALIRFATHFPQAQAIQLVSNVRQEEWLAPVLVTPAGDWLKSLDA